MTEQRLLISIVSHGQGDLVRSLLDDLQKISFSDFKTVNIVITLNIPENEDNFDTGLQNVFIVRNVRPLGFGANHNQAFSMYQSDIFVVLNPDVRLVANSFERIAKMQYESWDILGPVVKSSIGDLEDSARRYPSVVNILKRVVLTKRTPDYRFNDADSSLQVDWVAGMFVCFKSDRYIELSGFDTDYFMYLEDADICCRASIKGMKVIYTNCFEVIHDARRGTLKNATHFKWHLRSMIRFIFRF